MRLTYRFVAIAVNLPPGNDAYVRLDAALRTMGAGLDRSGTYAITLDDDDPDLDRWFAFAAAHRDRVAVRTSTAFDVVDLDRADHLALHVPWLNGYPQPDDDFRYRAETYDLEHHCEACGIGAVQRGPFRLRSEPRWGTRTLMGLNWERDAVFCRPAIWRAVFRPLAVETWPVLHHRSGRPLETVVQLRLEVSESAHLDASFDQPDICAACSRPKYSPNLLGPVAPLVGSDARPIYLTPDWYGSGAEALHPVIVTQDARRAMLDASLTPLHFRPLTEPPASPRPVGRTVPSPGPTRRRTRRWGGHRS